MHLRPPPGTNFVTLHIHDASGKELPCVLAQGPRAKRCRGLAMIQGELARVIAQLDEILKDQEDSLVELRWHSAVITYGRCFASADGRGTKLEISHVKELGKNELMFHNELIELRNQYIAHSGKNEQQRVFVALPITGSIAEPRIEQVVYQEITEIGPGIESFQKFRQLAVGLAAVADKMLAAAEEVLLAEYRALSPQSLLAAAGVNTPTSGESAA